MSQTFDSIADAYDHWYDTPRGRAIFSAELACLRSICTCRGRWLEVGVGTGRFAAALGVAEGIDPSPRMLEIAAARGIRTHTGCAEQLPFADDTFDGVLLALTLCFVAEPGRAALECRRVLHPSGQLLIGAVPANGPWGRQYENEKAAGHPVYSHARFLTNTQMVALIERAGFKFQAAASTLFWTPEAAPEIEPGVDTGVVPEAGFVGLLFT